MPLLMCVINIRNLTKLALSIKIYYMEFHTFMSWFFFQFCVCLFLLQNVHQHFCFLCLECALMWFSHFLVPSLQRNHRKSFYCHGKYFVKENFHVPAWTSGKFYCGTKNGKSRAGSITPSWLRVGIPCVVHWIWFILLAHGASHIIKRITIIFCFIFCCYSKEKLDSRTEWHSISVFKPSLQEKVNAYVRKGYACFLIVVAFLLCH